jgi:23S rRNA U2552 (ribose-2'-O)-methylase RlmE/FtsJ
VANILSQHVIMPGDIDVLISDMAPNTIGLKDIDAIRLFDLLDQTFWLYEEYLRSTGKFVIKVFM